MKLGNGFNGNRSVQTPERPRKQRGDEAASDYHAQGIAQGEQLRQESNERWADQKSDVTDAGDGRNPRAGTNLFNAPAGSEYERNDD